MNGLDQLRELSKYLTNLESELSQFWNLNISLLSMIKGQEFMKVNPSWERVLGYTSEEMKGKAFYTFIHPDDIKITEDAYKELLAKNTLTNFINRYKHKDGHYIYLNWACSYDPTNDIIYTVAQDISEEVNLRSRLRLKQKAVEFNGNAIIIASADDAKDYPIIYVNPAFEKITGYSSAEVIGKNPRFLQGDKRDQAVANRLKNCLIHKEPFEGVLINYKKNGEMYYNKTKISPMFNEKGICTHFVSSQYDATDEINQIKQLVESKERIKTVLDLNPTSIFLTNKTGDKHHVNKAWRQLVGSSPIKEDIDWFNILPLEELDNIKCKWKVFIDNNEKNIEIEHNYIHAITNDKIPVITKAYFLDEEFIIGFVEKR